MRAHNDEQGVTLVELMVAIAIIGVVIAALYLSYFTGVSVFGFNQETVEFHRDQRLISEFIGKEIRSADEEIEIIDSDELLIKYKDGKEIKFYKKNDNYIYKEDSTVGERKISQLTVENDDIFSYKDGKLVNINITLSNTNGKSYSFEEKFYPRIEDVLVTP